MNHHRNPEAGFAFSAIALIVGIITGLIISWLVRSAEINFRRGEHNWQSSQAYLNSLSGLHLKMQQVIDGDMDSVVTSDITAYVKELNDSVIQVNSIGTEGTSTRVLSVNLAKSIDSLDLIDRNVGISYEDTNGVGGDFSVEPWTGIHWWVTDDEDFFHHDIMLNWTGGIFIGGGPGGHLRWSLTMDIPPRDCICEDLLLDLAAAKDAGSPESFTWDDVIYIFVNGDTLGEFRGESINKKGPLVTFRTPFDKNILPDFQEFHFDITGYDSAQVSIEVQFDENMYFGIDRFRLDGKVPVRIVYNVVPNTIREN